MPPKKWSHWRGLRIEDEGRPRSLIMSVLVDERSRIIVQGITGKEGKFHTYHCMNYESTNIVAGVTPGKGGTMFAEVPEGKKAVPVYNTVAETVKQEGANVSVIFVPPAFAAD